MSRDDLDRKVESELLHQVRAPLLGEQVHELVHHPLDEIALPPFEHLGAEGRRHERSVQTVLGFVHLEDGPPHHLTHDSGVHRRRIGLAVAQDLDRLVEPEDGHRRRPVRIGLGLGHLLAEIDVAHVHRRLPAQFGEARVGIADVARDGVLQLEGVEGDRRGSGLERALRVGGHRRSPLVPPAPKGAAFRQCSSNVRLTPSNTRSGRRARTAPGRWSTMEP